MEAEVEVDEGGCNCISYTWFFLTIILYFKNRSV